MNRPPLRPVTIKARLNNLERELRPFETYEERQAKALLTHWLADCEGAAELWAEWMERLDASGSPAAVLVTGAGKSLMMAMADSLFDFEPTSTDVETIGTID
jgi:hypothetical protein